jgi:arsenate reductase
MERFKVLFLCTENACRSQMAEGLVNHYLGDKVKAFSAGVKPTRVNPRAVRVMAELGIDLSRHYAKSVEDLAGERFDLVITVCDQAREQCPLFPGDTEVMHVGFPDPARAEGTEAEVMDAFREGREALRRELLPLLESKLGPRK